MTPAQVSEPLRRAAAPIATINTAPMMAAIEKRNDWIIRTKTPNGDRQNTTTAIRLAGPNPRTLTVRATVTHAGSTSESVPTLTTTNRATTEIRARSLFHRSGGKLEIAPGSKLERHHVSRQHASVRKRPDAQESLANRR